MPLKDLAARRLNAPFFSVLLPYKASFPPHVNERAMFEDVQKSREGRESKRHKNRKGYLLLGRGVNLQFFFIAPFHGIKGMYGAATHVTI